MVIFASIPVMRRFKPFKPNFLQALFVSGFLTILSAFSANAQNLETREIDLKGCIQTIFEKEFIIKNRETFLKTIRNDASRDFCLKNLETIDFDKHALVGIGLNTGYCRRPLGLKAQAVKESIEKQIILKISYAAPQETCRALSQYDLWILIPKIPENYTVKFDVSTKFGLS